MENNISRNLDRELYADDTGSLHVNEGGGIGINVNHKVVVKTLKAWHALASHEPTAWIATKDGQVLHFSVADGWQVEIVQTA